MTNETECALKLTTSGGKVFTLPTVDQITDELRDEFSYDEAELISVRVYKPLLEVISAFIEEDSNHLTVVAKKR